MPGVSIICRFRYDSATRVRAGTGARIAAVGNRNMGHSSEDVSRVQGVMAELLRGGKLDTIVLLKVDNYSRLEAREGARTGAAILEYLQNLLRRESGWSGPAGKGRFALLQVDETRVREIGTEFRRGCERLFGCHVPLSGGGVKFCAESVVAVPETVVALYGAAAEMLALAKQRGGGTILRLTAGASNSDPHAAAAGHRLYQNLAQINAEKVRHLEIESRVDSLTGLYNRRGFNDIFDRLVGSAARSKQPLALIYLDSDNLKDINDSKGHEAGDRFIVQLSTVLQSVLRRSDFIFRWGADEFTVIPERTEAATAARLAERLRTAVEERTEGTISVGIYYGVPSSADEALSAADAAMYAAKQGGRNRIVLNDHGSIKVGNCGAGAVGGSAGIPGSVNYLSRAVEWRRE